MSDDQNALPPGWEKASNARVHNYLKITKLMPVSYLFPLSQHAENETKSRKR